VDVVPVRIGVLVNQLQDGLIVMDNRNQIIEIKSISAELFHEERNRLIGSGLDNLLQKIPELDKAFDQKNTLPQEITLNGSASQGSGFCYLPPL